MLLVPNHHWKHDQNNQNNQRIQYLDHIWCHRGETDHVQFWGRFLGHFSLFSLYSPPRRLFWGPFLVIFGISTRCRVRSSASSTKPSLKTWSEQSKWPKKKISWRKNGPQNSLLGGLQRENRLKWPKILPQIGTRSISPRWHHIWSRYCILRSFWSFWSCFQWWFGTRSIASHSRQPWNYKSTPKRAILTGEYSKGRSYPLSMTLCMLRSS